MTRNKAARSSGNYNRAKSVVPHDTDILAETATAFLGFALLLGVPTILAVLKMWGWW